MTFHSPGRVIEINANKITGPDIEFRNSLDVQRIILVGKNGGMDGRMQCFDPAAKNFREAG